MKKTGSHKIAQRYVKALLAVAEEAKARDAVEKDLSLLAQAVEADDRFADFLANPLMTEKQQANLLNDILTPLDAHDVTRRFVALLAMRGRLPLLADIAQLYAAKVAEARGEMRAELITAAPLALKDIQAISAELSKAYGKTVSLEASQDESLLGGSVLRIDSKQLDGSLAGKLKRLEQKLKSA